MVGLAVGIALFASVAYATVKGTEPSARTISVSDVIGVARVDRVLGREPFTNKNPPSVQVTIRDGIKGATRGEVIRAVGWVTGAPIWETTRERDTAFRQWESRPSVPPAIGAEVLIFLKRTGPHEATPIRATDGSVFVLSPDPRTVEIVRGETWLTFAVRPIPRILHLGRPFEIGGGITNHSADSMVFDLRHARVTHSSMPTVLEPGERWQPHPPPPIRLAPGERREYSFSVEDLSPVPIGVPGVYSIGFQLPANVNDQGSFVSVYFQIEGETKPREAAAASKAVFAATVDSIYRFRPEVGPVHGVSLSHHQFLLGELNGSPPGNVQFVDWLPKLPLRPIRGRRYLFFLNGQWGLFHVAEMNRDNLDAARAGVARGPRE